MPKIRIPYNLRLNEYFALVEELLPGASPVGAYCMGLAVRLLVSHSKRIWLTRELLLQLRNCGTVKDGIDVMTDWCLVQGRRAGGAS